MPGPAEGAFAVGIVAAIDVLRCNAIRLSDRVMVFPNGFGDGSLVFDGTRMAGAGSSNVFRESDCAAGVRRWGGVGTKLPYCISLSRSWARPCRSPVMEMALAGLCGFGVRPIGAGLDRRGSFPSESSESTSSALLRCDPNGEPRKLWLPLRDISGLLVKLYGVPFVRLIARLTDLTYFLPAL